MKKYLKMTLMVGLLTLVGGIIAAYLLLPADCILYR